MFGSEVLDLAIGLIFIYLVLSLICSAACELIESFFRVRALYLHRGLRVMLNDPDGNGIVREIYKHPLVSSLFASPKLPSYIPAGNFALALMDVIGLCAPRTDSPTTLSNSVFSASVAATASQSIRSTLQTSTTFNPPVSQALLVLADSAGYDPTRIRQNIEAWYDSSMDQVSGWFKGYSQRLIFGLGLVLSLAINADTLSIVNSLTTDRAVRASLIAAAAESAKNPAPLASGQSPANSPVTPAAPESFQAILKQIQNTGLPLGWKNNSPTDARIMFPNPSSFAIKFLGLVLTAFAITLGGPFWFDVLNRFMVVRSAVKPSEKSPEDAFQEPGKRFSSTGVEVAPPTVSYRP